MVLKTSSNRLVWLIQLRIGHQFGLVMTKNRKYLKIGNNWKLAGPTVKAGNQYGRIGYCPVVLKTKTTSFLTFLPNLKTRSSSSLCFDFDFNNTQPQIFHFSLWFSIKSNQICDYDWRVKLLEHWWQCCWCGDHDCSVLWLWEACYL